MLEKKIRVIVLGGHVSSLGIIRNLRYKNVVREIWSDKKACISRFSRYCNKFRHINLNIDDIIQKASNTDKFFVNVIFPTTDFFVKLISQNRDKLLKNNIIPATDDWYKVKNFHEKEITYKLANQLQIPTPKIFNISSKDFNKDKLTFPVVVKPSVMHSFYKIHRKKAFLCNDLSSLKNKVALINETGNRAIVQELVEGKPNNNFSCCVLIYNGVKILSVSARRRRQYPLDFGASSTFVQTEKVDIEKLSIKLLKHIKINGLFEVEFKYDSKSSEFKLLEVNPRVWKWHTIGSDKGFNFINLYFRALIGFKIKQVEFNYNNQLIWEDYLADKLSLTLSVIKKYEKIRELNPFTASHNNKIYGVFSLKDPLPGLAYFSLIISTMLGSR